MLTVQTLDALRERIAAWHAAGETVAFVPTMGNLHAGHLALVDAARSKADHVVASIFVNPTQFGPGEDFDTYPRTEAEDAEQLQSRDCDLLFLPSVETMYPRGAEAATRVSVPGVSEGLCGEFRPGHFDGVATVVARLFNMVQPDVAVFGEKDFQQLLVIRRMTDDLGFPVEIVGVPTLREANGLAMSSRNQYLSDEEKQQAARLFATLNRVADGLREGRPPAELEAEGLASLETAGFRPDYLAVRKSTDLGPPSTADLDLVVLVAAHLGKARLIDNLQVNRGVSR